MILHRIPMSNRFLACFPFTLAEECPDPTDWPNAKNFSNDPRDRGGATMCGIIQREYDHYRKLQRLATQPVIHCSEDEGMWIYENWYWLPDCDSLPVGLDLSFFDAAVNQGTTEAVKILQVSLDVVEDGIWGPITAEAVLKASPASAVLAFANRRLSVYESTPNFSVFGHDWVARNGRIRDESLRMING